MTVNKFLDQTKLETYPGLSYNSLVYEFKKDLPVKAIIEYEDYAEYPIQNYLVLVKDKSDLQLHNSLSTALGLHKFDKLSSELLSEQKINGLIAPFENLLDLPLFPKTYGYGNPIYRVVLVGSFLADEVEAVEKYFGEDYLLNLVLFTHDGRAYLNLLNEGYSVLPKTSKSSSSNLISGSGSLEVEIRDKVKNYSDDESVKGFVWSSLSNNNIVSYVADALVSDSKLKKQLNDSSQESYLVPFKANSYTHLSVSLLYHAVHRREHFFDYHLKKLESQPQAPKDVVVSSVFLTITMGLEMLNYAVSTKSASPVIENPSKICEFKTARQLCAKLSADCFTEALELLDNPNLDGYFDEHEELKDMFYVLPQLIEVSKIYQHAVQ